MKQRKMYDWLVIVFIHEIQNDLDYSNAIISAIEKAGCSDNIAVFLIRDSVSVDEEAREFSFRLGVSKLEPLSSGGGWAFMPVTSPNLKIRNKNKGCWDDAFRYIYGEYFGERNMMITFSEGAGFGINADVGTHVQRPDTSAPHGFVDLAAGFPAGISAEVPGDVLAGLPADLPAPRGLVATNKYYLLDEDEMNGLLTDPESAPSGIVKHQENMWVIEKGPDIHLCKNLEVLWISQLAEALNRYLYGADVDVFLMSNCFMQLFDNGYTLSSKVKFLVAAEGYMSMRGYDFAALMKLLNTTPAISAESIVKQVLIDLNQLYQRVGDAVASSSATIFANRLKFYPLALRVFEDLLEELEPLLPRIAPKLQDIRNQMLCVTNNPKYPLVDAGLWVRLVAEQVRELENGDYYAKIFGELQEKIVVGNLLDKLSQASDQTAARRHGYSGISIYFPLDDKMHENQEIVWCAYFDKAIKAPFRERSRWHEFLKKYFAALANVKKPA